MATVHSVCESSLPATEDHSNIQRTQLPVSSPVAVEASSCWLTSLQLMAVQPACLKAHPATPTAQQQPQLQGTPGVDQQQHDLLLHLEAVLAGEQHHAAAYQECAAGTGCYPAVLSGVELQVVLLSRQMQVIQQQQYSLLQLILQQQGQQPFGQQPLVLLPTADASSTPAVALCSDGNRSSSSVGPVVVSTPGSLGRNCLALNLHVSMPCRPSDRLLDALHLVLTVSGSASQQHNQQSVRGNSSTLADTSFPDDPGGLVSSSSVQQPHHDQQQHHEQPGPTLIAEVPLLVLPAVAQQEVQQLLLPAMRQEVQAEQQQEQGVVDVAPEKFARQVLQVEYAAWRHYSQLANDVFAVMELAVAAEAEAAAAAAATAAAGCHLQTSVAGAAAAPQMPSSIAVLPTAIAPAASAELSPAAGSMMALGDIADALLFPLLLPFLAAHGLHGVLQLLVGCLPLHLQQQWQQQQLLRLQHLSASAPPALQLPVVLEDDQQQAVEWTATEAAAAATHIGAPTVTETPTSAAGGIAGVATAEPAQHMSADKATGAVVFGPSAGGRKAVAAQPQSPMKPDQASAGSRSSASGAVDGAVASTHVTWLTPLTQFDSDMEGRYLAWKHHSFIHLDYLCVMFDIMYLAVLLKRLISEPATLWYLMYICIKTLPHLPLVLGLRQPFLRYREVWLFLVAPACLLLTWSFTMFSRVQGQPTLLLPNRAYKAFIASRAELVTSFMRPFMQHMRLPLYIVYCVLDAAITSWVAGQVVGFRVVAKRWSFAAIMSITICWVFELVLRRRFIVREQQSQRAGGAAARTLPEGSESKNRKETMVQSHKICHDSDAAGPSSIQAPLLKQKQV